VIPKPRQIERKIEEKMASEYEPWWDKKAFGCDSNLRRKPIGNNHTEFLAHRWHRFPSSIQR
jgi:hypothetical protein